MPGPHKPIRLTGPALADIRDIWEFVARESIESADRLVAAVDELINGKIASYPEAYQFHPELGELGIRSAHHSSWLILYRIHPQDIQILRVVHGGRNLRILRLEDA